MMPVRLCPLAMRAAEQRATLTGAGCIYNYKEDVRVKKAFL